MDGQPASHQPDSSAWDQLISQQYGNLRRLARAAVRRDGASVEPTELLNSVLRNLRPNGAELREPGRLLAIVSWKLRRRLIDRARRERAQKRGGDRARVHFDPGRDVCSPQERTFDFIDLHEALNALRALDRRKWRLVELRFFGGLSVDEAAKTLGVSASTIEKDWAYCRAWLHGRLSAQ